MAGSINSIVSNNELIGNLTENNVAEGHVRTAYNPVYAVVTEAAAQVVLYISSIDYKLYAELKDKSGNHIADSNVIDLPLETMVVNGDYDSLTKEVILTLDNGNTIRFSVADLISGLQSEITSSNKLSSDLVDDTNKTHLFVSDTEKNTWNNKLDSEDLIDYVKNTDYASSSTGGVIKTNDYYGANISDSGNIKATVEPFNRYNNYIDNAAFISKGTLENVIAGKDLETANNKVVSISSSSTDTEYPSAKCVYDLVGDINTALDTINGEVI